MRNIAPGDFVPHTPENRFMHAQPHIFRAAGAGLVLAWLLAISAPAQIPGVLTNAVQIRNLTAGQAAQALPVNLQGVMVCVAASVPMPSGAPDLQHSALVLLDSTAAIYLTGTTNLLAGFHEGDQLQIDGVTDPGQFAPYVQARSVHRLGTAAIPPPLPVTYQKLITGGLDAQWVEVSGVVRSWEPITAPETFGKWILVLAVNGNKITITATGPHPPQVQPDAEVRVRCVCFYQFNQQRQVLNPALVMPRDATAITVEQPAPTAPFDTPVRAVASLLQFAPGNTIGHWIHLRGTVIHQQSPARLWFRDGSGAASILTRPMKSFQPGDEIDVLGFPRFGVEASALGTAALEDAIVQKVNSGPPPRPVDLAAPDEAFRHDSDLVSIKALLTDVEPILNGEALSLQAGGKTFTAVLENNKFASLARNWQPGSRVLISGICSVVNDDSGLVVSGVWHPQSFQILLRSPDDVTILAEPPWWTPEHIILLLGTVIGGLLLATGILVLRARRRLQEQARQRAMAEAEFAAILSERNRMAREIHDTLAQGLVATSVQLRLAKKQAVGAADSLNHHLDTAQQLVRGSLEEARKSIWNMRSQVLETGDLPSALQGILKQMTEGSEVKAAFEVVGRPRRLAPVLESNILRTGQEAITNAVKHARAAHISVKMEFDENRFRLIVADDGCGFDLTHPPRSDGGFGLVGMRERAAESNGELAIHSHPGRGTEVCFQLLVSGE